MKIAALAFCLLALPALAAPGDLDSTFDGDGRLSTSFGGSFSSPQGVAQQADGKAVVAGHTANGLLASFAIARYNVNGSLDTSFSGDGRATVDFPGGDAFGQAVALQDGGKILVAGYIGELGVQIALARLNSDGSLDTSFGAGGRATLVVPGTTSINATDVFPMPDGRIVVAGTGFDGAKSVFAVARLNHNGTPDTSFSTDGFALVAPSGDSFVEKLIVQPDLKVVLAGYNGTSFLVARLNADGSPDAGFGSGGIVSTNASVGTSLLGLALQPDGKLVISGSNDFAGGSDVVVVRYNANGSLDGGFGSAGITVTNLGSFDDVADLVLLPNGKLIVAGSVFNGSIFEAFLLRYNANGTLDTTFGINGHATAAMEAGHYFVDAALRQLDGKIVLAGEYLDQFGLQRLLGAPEDALAPAGDADNDGVPSSVEYQEGLNALIKDNNIFQGARLFAMQQYRDFLGREGDAGGIDFYTQQIGGGTMPREQVIENFLGSPEFQNGLPQVIRLYFSFFLRIPDYPGLTFQVQQFRSGVPLETISQNFANSPEFTNRYGTLNNDQYIHLVYQNVLGRAPDPGGYDFYKTRLDNGSMTRGQMMLGFSESPEFQQLKSDEVFVVSVYVGMLKRTPEQSGLDFYIDLLEGGTPRRTVISGFLNAPEYRSRFLP